MILICISTFIALLNISAAFSLNGYGVNLITFFAKTDFRPTSVLILNLCWSQHDIKKLSKVLNKEDINIAVALQPNRTDHYLNHILVVSDLSCDGVEDTLIKASEGGFFKSPYRWLLLDMNNENHYKEILNNIEILTDSDVVIAKKEDDEEVVFIEAYQITRGSKIFYTTRFIWNPSKFLFNASDTDKGKELLEPNKRNIIEMKYGVAQDLRTSQVLAVRRSNLRGHVLTMVNVVTDTNDTRNHLGDRLDLGHDSITKMTYLAVKHCFEMINATERLLYVPTWGYKDEHGKWQGLMELIVKKEVDLGTITLFTKERLREIDYLAMVGSTRLRFVFREPPLSYIRNIFLLPFTAGVWIATLVLVFVCSVFLYITSKWEATRGQHPTQLDGSCADVLILIIGAVLQQGCMIEPRYSAGRCVFYCLFICLTTLFAAYCANILVLLRAPSSSIRTVEDLLNSPLKCGASNLFYNKYFFKRLNEPVRQEILHRKIEPKGKKENYFPLKEGIEMVRKGLFAFHLEVNPGYRIIQETFLEGEKCDLREIDYFNEISPWLPAQKRSPYKDMFKINFFKIRESGIQSCIQNRIQIPKPTCSGSIPTFSSVGIVDMYPVLISTVFGMVLAVAVLVLEIFYSKLILMRNVAQSERKKKQSRPKFGYRQ